MEPQTGYTDSIELNSCIIYKRNDGVLVYEIKPDIPLVLEDVKRHLAAFLEIEKGGRSPLIVYADHLKRLGPEEKAFMNATITQFATKLAIMTVNPLPTFIYRIAFYLTPPPVPSQIFKTEKEALEWLKA
ncbi:MAG: hypothetical protein K0Q95_2639 [Bacteroidota bacterium]|jgi:hypothetical protein|nr:hypothetical protein [Bacteroidota bacterium]